MAYTCKRLRGWELEKESGMLQRKALGKAPAEPERESQLATKLLSLWAHGMLSAILVRELADLALQDKADHVELVALAKTGNWGSQKGNVHKQKLPKKQRKMLQFSFLIWFLLVLEKTIQSFLKRCAILEKVSWKSFGKVSKPLVMIA